MMTSAETTPETPQQQRAFKSLEAAALVVLVLIHLLILIFRLDLYSFYVDEAGYWRKVSKSVAGMLAALAQDNIPPLYFFLLKGWYHAFGRSEIALRSLSVVFALANVVLLWAFVRRFWTAELALLVTLLFVLSPLNVFCARLVKYFSFFTFLILLVHYFFFSLLESGERKRHAIAFTVAAICLIYTHYLGFVVLGVLAVVYLSSKRTTKVRVRRWLLMHAVILLCYVPWLVPFIKRIGATASTSAGTAPSPVSSLLALALRVVYACYAFCFGHTIGPWHLILIAVGGCTLAFLFARGVKLIYESPTEDFSRAIVLMFVANFILAAVVLSLFLPGLHFVFFSERIVFLLPFALLIIARGMIGLRRAAVAFLAVIFVVNAFSLSNLLTASENTVWSYLIPWQEIRAAIQPQAPQHQLILFDNYHFGSTGLYYLAESGDFREIWDEQHESVVVNAETAVAGCQRVCFIRSVRDITPAKTLASIEAILKNHFNHVDEKSFVHEPKAFFDLKKALRRDKSSVFENKIRVLIFSEPRTPTR
jgi:uncharacterized membrane protein